MNDPIIRKVRVIAEGDGYRSRVINHAGIETNSDEPPALGGAGAGFGPFELLAASLAACTVATLRMYARRKQWSLNEIEVEAIYQRAGEDDLPKEGPDRITRTINLGADLSEDQRTRLADIATRCPVAKMLGKSVSIRDQLADIPDS